MTAVPSRNAYFRLEPWEACLLPKLKDIPLTRKEPAELDHCHHDAIAQANRTTLADSPDMVSQVSSHCE